MKNKLYNLMENKSKNNDYYIGCNKKNKDEYKYSYQNENHNKFKPNNGPKDPNNINENNTYRRPKIINSHKYINNNINNEPNSKNNEINELENKHNGINALKQEIDFLSSENGDGKIQIKNLKKENELLKKKIEKRGQLLEELKKRCMENEKKKGDIKTAIHNMKKYIKMHSSSLLIDDKLEEEMAINAVERQIISELSSNPNSDQVSYEQILKMQNNKNNKNIILSEDKLSKIPEITFNKKLFGNIEQCFICMDQFKENEILKQINCGHLFHKECLTQWLLNENKCPICNKDCLT